MDGPEAVAQGFAQGRHPADVAPVGAQPFRAGEDVGHVVPALFRRAPPGRAVEPDLLLQYPVPEGEVRGTDVLRLQRVGDFRHDHRAGQDELRPLRLHAGHLEHPGRRERRQALHHAVQVPGVETVSPIPRLHPYLDQGPDRAAGPEDLFDGGPAAPGRGPL